MSPPLALPAPLAAALLLAALAPAAARAERGFTEDPLPESVNTFVFGNFMELHDHPQTNYLHTGVDVAAAPGDAVYPPIPLGAICRVVAVGPDWVLLIASQQQEAQWVLTQLVHIEVHPLIIVGAWLDNTICVGWIGAESHLHAMLYLSPDDAIDAIDLVHPLVHAFDNAPWLLDTTPPVLTDSVEVSVPGGGGEPFVWSVPVADRTDLAPHQNGVYRIELLVNGEPADEIRFERFVGRNGAFPPAWSDYYAVFSPPPSGLNDPNTLRYKLVWTPPVPPPEEIVWCIRTRDALGNVLDCTPSGPTVVAAVLPAPPALRIFPNPVRVREDGRVRIVAGALAAAAGGGGLPPAVTAAVYDARGRLVRALRVPQQPVPGRQLLLEWNLRAGGGQPVASGVYWIRVREGGASWRARPLVVMR